MAHRKEEDEGFQEAVEAGVPVVAFTATRWRTLLAGHADWDRSPPTAADCYRFALSAPAVEVVLTAPRTTRELRGNLEALVRPGVTAAERREWCQLGDLVYSETHRFETAYP